MASKQAELVVASKQAEPVVACVLAPSPSSATSRSSRPFQRSSITCTSRSATSANRVRNGSCRATRSPTAASSTGSSSSVRPSAAIRSAAMTLNADDCGSSRWRNHSRSWAGDAGTGNSRPTGTMAAVGARDGAAPKSSETAASASMRAESASSVGVSNSCRTGITTGHCRRIRETSLTASSECPPSAKKSSVAATAPRFSTSDQIPASNRSVSDCGARPCGADATCIVASGAGSAWRSILPLGVSGSASRTTKAVGTMYSGSRRRTASRLRCTSSSRTGSSASITIVSATT